MSGLVDGVGHGQVAVQDVIHHFVIFLLKTGVRDAFHHAELFVGVRQSNIKVDQVLQGRNAIEFTTQNEGGHFDLCRIHTGNFEHMST